MKKRTVVIGLLGSNLDRGSGPHRWNRWRPTVSICQHEDHLVDRLELILESKFQDIAEKVAGDVRTVSPETEVNLHTISLDDPWDLENVYAALHDFARSYDFDPDKEEYLLHITTGTHVAQICLYLLAESQHIPAKLLQTSPPDRNESPGKLAIIDLDLSRYDRIAQRFYHEQLEGLNFLKSGIETRNAEFNHTIEQIEHVAIHSRDPVLVMGPTGAGKSQLARRIYELKKTRRQLEGRFVEVNCATIRGDAAMSTLFGHVKGAYTGAAADRSGLLREADKGLLFLDEIGELGGDEQTMLLRAVEEKCFLPLGADEEVESSFQLICGTNRNLLSQVKAGDFREDLLARINMWTFHLPGLAERREDIEPNLHYELEQLTAETGRQFRFNREAQRRFLDFATSPEASWSANFRDLNAAVRRMATFAPSGRITREVVDEEIRRLRRGWPQPDDPADLGELHTVLDPATIEELDLFDQLQLASVLRICRESRNLSEAGRKLFAASRTRRKSTNDADRLRKFLLRFGLTGADVCR